MTNPNPPTARSGIRPSQSAANLEHQGATAKDPTNSNPTKGAAAERGPNLNPEASQSTAGSAIEGQGFDDAENVMDEVKGLSSDLNLFLAQAVTGFRQLMAGHLVSLEHQLKHPSSLNPNKDGTTIAIQQTADLIARADQVLTTLKTDAEVGEVVDG